MHKYYPTIEVDPERLLRNKFIEMAKKEEISFTYLDFIKICGSFWSLYFEHQTYPEFKAATSLEEISEIYSEKGYNYKFIEELKGLESVYILYSDNFAEEFFKLCNTKYENNNFKFDELLTIEEMNTIFSSLGAN